MDNLNNKSKKKNYVTTTTTTFLLLATILVVTGVSTPLTALASRSGDGEFIDPVSDLRSARAPVVVSGDNICIAWWTNNTENGNQEVMFRASNDGGATFADKINLSNSSEADSWRVEIHGEADTVVVSWWETNQTSDVPVARVSTDGGATFGPLMMLAANGTLGSGEAEEIAAIVEEE